MTDDDALKSESKTVLFLVISLAENVMCCFRTAGFSRSIKKRQSNPILSSLAPRRNDGSPVDGSGTVRVSGFALTNALTIGNEFIS